MSSYPGDQRWADEQHAKRVNELADADHKAAMPCPACAEKDAEIARLIAALEFERDPCRRAVSKDGRCEHEARATAAEEAFANGQKNEHATAAQLSEMLSGGGASTWDEIMHAAESLKERATAAEQERDKFYRAAIEHHEWLQEANAKLAAAERREAEKDRRVSALERLWTGSGNTMVPMTANAVDRYPDAGYYRIKDVRVALASPSTPSGESMGLSGDLIVTGQQPSTPSPAPSSTCPPCAQLLAWEAETRTATSTPSPAPSAEEPRYAPCAACVSEIGRVDPACRYCGGTGRCSSGATVDQIVGSTGRLVERLRASRPSPPPRSAPREAGAQPAEEQS
jgi:hypothetical protein